MPFAGVTGPIVHLRGFTGKPSVKADLTIYDHMLGVFGYIIATVLEYRLNVKPQGQRNVFTTGPAKLDHEDYAIKCVGSQQLYEY